MNFSFRRVGQWTDSSISIVLFVALSLVYFGFGRSYPLPDNLLHLRTAERLLTHGVFTLSADEVPSSLEWSLRVVNQPEVPVRISAWDESLRERVQSGQLVASLDPSPMTALARGPRPGTYMSVFMPGTPLTALPAVAVCLAFRGERPLPESTLYVAGKATAAVCTAGAAALLFLLACQWGLRRSASLVLCFTYAFATCVWTINSQSLWQHGPNGLYLATGMYFLLKPNRRRRDVVFAALAMSAATWVRPTSGIFALAGCFNAGRRGELVWYVIVGMFAAQLMAIYNAAFFGAPWTLGESVVVRDALFTTNVESVWSTPFLEGAAGLLFSPSRGLFVFSPFLLASMVGFVMIWRDVNYRPLRPWTIAVLVIWTIHFKYYDWWGGWSFGYRPVIDTVFMLMLFLIPLFQSSASESKVFKTLFAAGVGWSVAIQLLAILAFDPFSWNGRTFYAVVSPQGTIRELTTESDASAIAPEVRGTVKPVVANIDLPKFRHRLWSLSDSQIAFLLDKLPTLYRTRPRIGLGIADNRVQELAITHASVAEAYLKAGDVANAKTEIARAQEYAPTHPYVLDVGNRILGAHPPAATPLQAPVP